MSEVVVLTGGVGGAKLVLGLCELIGHANVTAIVNTGDDFTHLGLHISPDIDTLLYTLAGLADPVQGWGRGGESWNFMAALRSLGGADWFALGDGDLALHVLRTSALRAGVPLSAVTAEFARRWNIAAAILPATDQPLATMVETDEGVLPFQSYFVERRCEPEVRGIFFEGAQQSRPAAGVVEAIGAPATAAILIAPSNPYLSVDPILAVPGIRDALARAPAPVVAVSPVAAGKAFKGPTAKLMRGFGVAVDSDAVAAHYGDLLDGMVVDRDDPDLRAPLAVERTDIAMPSRERRTDVARAALALAGRIAADRGGLDQR